MSSKQKSNQVIISRPNTRRYTLKEQGLTSKFIERVFCHYKGHVKSEKKYYYGPHRVYNEDAKNFRCERCKKKIE